MIIHSSAIVLRRFSYSDTSIIARCFTKEMGKLSFIIRGAKRKKSLLHHFGSAEETKRAGLSDLERVDGISKIMAETIYNFFHDNK